MDRLILIKGTTISVNEIEEGNAGGIILCCKRNLIIGVIVYDEEQWKFINSIDFIDNKTDNSLGSLIEYLYNSNLIDKAILRD